jgi:membrane associated rhomboid family serine protease
MAYLLMAVGWALAGWCGTRSPKPRPEPPPPPIKVFIWGAIGGIIGGFLYLMAFSLKAPLSAIDYAATCIGAFVIGFVLEELVYQFTKK